MLAAEEMRRWDRRAIADSGIPERVLMEAAGRAAAERIAREAPSGPIAVVAGKGNNGGDALVVARTLVAWGRDVALVRAPGADGVLLHGWPVPQLAGADADRALRGAAMIVDGVLGTGATGAPRGPAAELVHRIAAAGRPVAALDVPSGVDPTSGAVAGEAVRAVLTITFGAVKRGLLRFPGREHAGRILGVEVGFPPLQSGEAGAWLVTPSWARARLPAVPPDAHKGTLGTVSVVAGHPGMAGAAIMVGTAAGRTGAGKVRLVSHAANRTALQTALPEALFADRNGDDLEEALAASHAVVAGPGMGAGDAERELLRRVLHAGDAPLLLDADALNLLARAPALLDGIERPVLLTPHPGEMARLLRCDVADVATDPFAAAADAAERWGCAVLLKGSPSLVAALGEPALVNVTGHSGIATGGMGDTLAGVAGALLAAGVAPAEAGALALFFSGRAAEIAGRGRGLLPRDVAEALPAALLARTDGSPLSPGLFLDLPVAR